METYLPNWGLGPGGVMDDRDDDVLRLQACINDLVSLTALPVMWGGQKPAQVAATLLDVVVRMLQLEFAYLRLADHADGVPVEFLSLLNHDKSERTPAEVGRALRSSMTTDPAFPARGVRNPVGDGEVSIWEFWLGLARESGVLVAAARRPEFPTKIETLLMTVAINLAVTELQRAQVIAARERAESSELLREHLHAENVYLRQELDSEHQWGEIVGRSPALKTVISLVERVAPTDACVLIQGETGTGKELIARAVHRLSGRNDEAFVKLNCAAIPTGLLESELFGHERGAFTGAIAQRLGRFEVAHRGTIFLDEVGEIPPELQTKLLRVLQEQEFERLGSTKTIHVDVRLVAASNRDLAQMVADRTFRSDLFYRLNVFPITLPPLRERAGDIPLLVRYFVQRHARRFGKPITGIAPGAMTTLSRYAWPGNVRELENLMERSVILSQGATLEVPLGELKPDSDPPIPASTLREMERTHIVRVLNECRWVIAGPSGAATRLGMKRTSLQYKMQKLGISRPD